MEEESEQSEPEDVMVLIEKKISTKHDEPVLIIELPKSQESGQRILPKNTPKNENVAAASGGTFHSAVSFNFKGSTVSFNPKGSSFGLVENPK